ncbi:MAG: hypothetical protein KAY37_09630 [Phycisphaerae bacterium]|nr:hypothetical protein [Phycisphaerae bacterium]
MAYDSARGRVVLFGGASGITTHDDTWEWGWDGTSVSWTEQDPPGQTPGPRHSHAMAYDGARRVVVLFGGKATGKLADTWEWDGTEWTSLEVSPAPCSRHGHSMAYDAARGKVVLFGGYDSQNVRLDDTWEWDGGEWTERTDLPPSRPSARAYAAMAHDNQRGVIVLFGGNQGGAEQYCGDTWEFDGTGWTQRTDSGPSAREGAAAAYDATSGRDCVVLFGGFDSAFKYDTWTWDGTAGESGEWSLESTSGPSGRYNHALAYCGKVLLFGGMTEDNENGSTYDYGANLSPQWACCFADGSCQDMAEAHCLGAGGASWREGETCSSCECAAPPPEAAYFLGDQPLSGSAAHQVNTATGNFHYSEVDLAIASRREPFVFARHYNSLDGRTGPLGEGWRHTYHIVLTPPNPPDQPYVAVTWSDGRTTFWNPDGPDWKPATRDLYDQIELSGGIWTVTRTNLDQYRFDSSGHLLNILPKGNSNNITSLDYDPVETDRVIKVTDPAGHWLDLGYTDDRLTSVADHTSRAVQFVYTAGRLTSAIDVLSGQIDYEYDGNGYLEKVKDQRQPQVTVITNTYAPDGTGRVFHYMDGNGNTTDFLYRADETEITQAVGGHEITRLHKSEMVYQRQTIDQDPLGHQVVYTYDENFNRETVKDRNGNVTSFTYDSLGNVTSVTDPDDPDDPNDGGTTSFEYNDSNVPHLPTRKTDTLSYVTDWTYDGRGNVLTEKRYLTVPPGDSFVQKSWTYNPFDQRLTATDERGNTHQWHYTAEGQLDYTIDREGNYTWYGYDSLWRRIWVTDGRGTGPEHEAHTSRLYYDADDRLIRTESPPVGDPSHLIVQEFGYDEVGNRTSVTDGNGNETTYAYDGNNNLRYVYQPLGRTTQYQYDELNRRVKTIDALYQATDYTYDDADRLTERRDAANNAWSYTHDDHGNVLTASEPSDSNPTGIIVSYQYDVLHRRTSASNELSHISRTEYDVLGRVTRTIDATNQPTQFTYDGLGRLTAVEDALGGRTEYTYDATGNLLQILDANGHAISVREYDDLNRLIQAEDGNGNYYTYGFDAVGNQTSVRDANAQPSGPTTTLTYDAVNRRTAMNYQDGSWVTFAYDDNGNLTSRTIDEVTTDFEYDVEDRLIAQIRDPDGTAIRVDHVYDGDGNRIARTESGAETRYVLDRGRSMSHVLCETDAGGSVIAYYIHGPTLVARIDAGGTPRYYHTNDLGNVVALTDADGVVVDRYAYDPYGLPVGHEGNTSNPFTFVGGLGVMTEDFDDPMALYFMRARFYDPDTGRFLGKDPVAGALTDPLGLNRYAYGLDNPLLHTDPSGEVINLITGAIGASVGFFGTVVSDVISGEWSDPAVYAANTLGGFVGGVTLNPAIGVAVASTTATATNVYEQVSEGRSLEEVDWGGVALDAVVAGTISYASGGLAKNLVPMIQGGSQMPTRLSSQLMRPVGRCLSKREFVGGLFGLGVGSLSSFAKAQAHENETKTNAAQILADLAAKAAAAKRTSSGGGGSGGGGGSNNKKPSGWGVKTNTNHAEKVKSAFLHSAAALRLPPVLRQFLGLSPFPWM